MATTVAEIRSSSLPNYNQSQSSLRSRRIAWARCRPSFARTQNSRWKYIDRSAQTKLATGELLALDNQIDTTTGTLRSAPFSTMMITRCFPTILSIRGCWCRRWKE